tara:strand:- start:740 stop:1531 length:792 start_codon:yes stop_codon:yes gene_type:complete
MLKKRIIPKLLLKFKKKNGTYVPILVNSFNYTHYKIIGDPISQAKIYEAQLADELILINIESLPINENKFILDLIKQFSFNIFMPLTVGGGVLSLNCFKQLLSSGADKVLINSSAILNPKFITDAAKNFGSQCVVVSIDFKIDENHEAKVFYNNGKKAANLNVLDWSKKAEDLGAGEIVLSDINKDGCNLGLNIELANLISTTIKIPVIISGGCGLAKHFIDCFKQTKVQGIAAGNFFSNKDQNIFETRSQIMNSNVPLRKVG